MNRNPEQARARELLRSVIQDRCLIGLVVAPDSPPEQLGPEAFRGLIKILLTNQFASSHEVFFDQGIFTTANVGEREAQILCSAYPYPCSFHFEQDSVQILGLQAADLVAHACATMLLAELGIVNKMVKAGENSGYDPDLDIELEFELWAGLRYNYFAAPPPSPDTWESQLDFQVDVESRGLHIAESCDPEVRNGALCRFGRMYLGCIH
jgi:hypothetical protein